MPDSHVSVKALTGAELVAALPALAELRITVFHDYPYLYDGTLAYEADYLANFAASKAAVCVAAYDGHAIIGASTGAAMSEQEPEFYAALAGQGYEIDKLFYCSESVLLKSYRGHGLGNAFFDLREAHARAFGGFTHSLFASVVRPPDHPMRPQDYRPLDAFWTKRGYQKADGLYGSYAWKDINEPGETSKNLQFWIKAL